MIMPFLLLFVAAEVLNLDDIGATKRRARTLLDGPDRCIEVRAEAKDTIVILSSAKDPWEKTDVLPPAWILRGAQDDGEETEIAISWPL